MRRRPELVLILLWGCFVARGVFYSALFPLWEGYDEYSHFAYVQHIVTYGSIPKAGVSRISLEISASLKSSPRPWTQRNISPESISYEQFWGMPPGERAARVAPLQVPSDKTTHQEDPTAELIYQTQHPALYHWILSPFLRLADTWSLPSRVFLLRCVSILIASAALPFGFSIARRVFGDTRVAAAVVAVAVCMPEAFTNFARVGNESLAMLVYTLLLWMSLRVLDSGVALRRTALLGIALGCGLLTKVYVLTAVPAICIIYALAWRRGKTTLRTAAVHATIAIAIAGVLSFWWYRLIQLATGDFTGQLGVAVRTVPWLDRISTALHLDWLRAIDTAMLSYIWFGGWSFLQVRSWIYHLFYAIGVAAIAGLLLLLLRRRAAISVANRQPLLVLGVFQLCFCASIAYNLTITQIIYGAPLTSGWYFYCLLFAEVILICAGLRALLPFRARAWAAPSLAALFALLDLYGVHFILLPYYTGLVAHRPTGGLPVFRLSQLSTFGIDEISARLMINRPYLIGPWEFWLLWALYWTATVVCVVIAIRTARAT